MPDPLPPDPAPAPPLPDPSETAFLLKYLETHDVPCPLCQYNLRHLTVPRCPECGREIKLTVGMVEQNLIPFVVLMTSVLLPAGMGIMAWNALFREGMKIYEYEGSLGLAALIGFQMSILPVVLAILWRRKFLKLPVETQWFIVGFVALEPAVLYGMLFFGGL